MGCTCECGAVVAKSGCRCRSCAARVRWATTRQPKRSFVEFGGVRYFAQPDGYFRSSRHRGNVLLHRAVWESANGPVPVGWHVHHIDGVTANNSAENLVALSARDHLSGEHGDRQPHAQSVIDALSRSARVRWETRAKTLRSCDECGGAYESRGMVSRFCAPACNTKYWNRKRSERAHGSGL